PRIDAVQKSFAKGPVNPTRFGLEASVGIEVTLNEISATESCRRANVLNLRAAFKKQLDRVSAVPVQRFFQRRPTTCAVDRRTTIEQQFSNWSIVNAARSNKRLIQFRASIDQDFRHLDCVRFIFSV